MLWTVVSTLPVFLSFHVAASIAAPAVHRRMVYMESCTDLVGGYLSGGSSGGVLQTFSLGADNETVVYGSMEDGIPVSFQLCSPNFGGWSNDYEGPDTIYAGHISVPSINKCLSVNSRKASNTYGLTVQPCSNAHDSRQIFQNFIHGTRRRMRRRLCITGTNAAGDHIQNSQLGCTRGWFGFVQPLEEGEPVVLACADMPAVRPFHVAASSPPAKASPYSPKLALQAGWKWVSALFMPTD